MTEDYRPEELSESFIRSFARRIQSFRDACSPENRWRGQKIFEEGGVHLLFFDDSGARANISEDNGEPFLTEVSFRGNEWSSSCSCSSWGSSDDHCRHVSALVRKIEQLKNEATGCAPFIGLAEEEEFSMSEAEARKAEILEDRKKTIALENAADWLGISAEACHNFRYDIDLIDVPAPASPASTASSKAVRRKMLSVSILRIDRRGGQSAAQPRPVKVDAYLKGRRLSPVDRKAFSLIENGRRTSDDSYLFNMAEAGALLQALSGSYVRKDGRPLDFTADAARICAELGSADVHRTFSLMLDSEGGRLALSSVEFISELPVFALHSGSVFRVQTDASLEQLKRWKSRPTLTIPRGDDESYTRAMDALTALGVSFGGDESCEWNAPPEFTLALDGNAEFVTALLAVRYGAVEFHLAKAGQKIHITTDGRLIRRNIQAEADAVDALKSAGLIRSGQSFTARGDRAIDFWSRGIQTLPRDWTFFGPKPRDVVRVRALTPSVTVKLSRNSWFDLDIAFSDGDASVNLAEIRSHISAGRRYVRLGDGSAGELPKALAEQIRRILEDTGKVPDGSKLSLEPYEAPEVERLLDSVPDAQKTQEALAQLEILAGRAAVEQVDVPSGFRGKFRPYQKNGFDWLVFLYKTGLGGVLADDMGLGKTIQALALLDWIKESGRSRKPHLVVAPTSVLTNWKREAARFTPEMKSLIYEGGDRESLLGKIDDADIVLTSYAIIRKDGDLLKRYKFDCIFLDEAQHVKNPASRGAKAIAALQGDHKFALTGTPVENQLSDLWSIFHLLMPGFLGSETFFRNTYARPIEADGDQTVRERLRRRINPFILRRLKQDVARDLPMRTDTVIPVTLTPGQQALYKDMASTARRRVEAAIDKFGIGRAHISILSELLRLRQVCNDPRLLKMPPGIQMPPSAKLEVFAELVRDLIDEGHKALVFSQFTEMLAILVDWARSADIPFEYLDGETQNRQERIDRFNSPEGSPLFFISLKAGGTGLNLTNADYVIIYDPWWNPAVEEQAINRAHRIGQDKPVFSYRLITQGTVEQKITVMQERKRRLAECVVSSDEDIGRQLTEKDLSELFSDDFFQGGQS